MIVVSAIALELALGAYYTVGHRELFWTRAIASLPVPTISDTRQLLSPIYGYALRPGWRPIDNKISAAQLLSTGHRDPPDFYYWPANNYGFMSPVDFPYEGTPGAFYVGVVGGSVANGLALEAREAIIETVARAASIDRERVVIINLSMGGFKQPQQAAALSYFVSIGQKLDIVVNLDGLNEAYMGWDNAAKFSAEPAQPSAQFLYGMQNHFLSVNGRGEDALRTLHDDANRLADVVASTRSAVRFYWTTIRLNRLLRNLVKAEAEIGQPVAGRRYPFILQRRTFQNSDALARHLADVWYRGSLMTRAIANAAGAAYVHALQPNQYIGGKTFSEAEAALAFSKPPWEGIDIVQKTYALMRKRGGDLSSKGVAFLDLTGDFDHVAEQLYFDACCHFNRRGYEILMHGQLGQSIAAGASRWQRRAGR